ncbi:PorT family protein [Chitinophaga silvatica]|uniref:PorT family protein n=1 Tax=Chitinophaga silvatica TaxID=2282649 RepID=A0A3E1Y6V6_9BACT|nr:outer membrane beta-barrel protein [Chitinophaga silvatica]RFS20675.1 PorT family protein [Chitinophaga silvatica]
MKLIFRLTILTAVGIFPLILSAQSKFSYQAKVGFNYSTAFETRDYIDGSLGHKPGYQAGVLAAYKISKSFYLQSGLQFTTKGSKHEGADVWIGSSTPPITYWVRNTNLAYLQLPVKIGYRIHFNSDFSAAINTGAYFSYGLGGNVVRKERTPGYENIPNRTIKYESFGDEQFSFNRPDIGQSFGCELAYKRYSIGFDYELGYKNIGDLTFKETTSTRVYKNRNMAFTIGYIFK